MKKLILKTMTLVTALAIAFIVVVCVKNEPVTANADSIEALETSENYIPDDSEVVVSYVDLFRQYYDQMELRMSEGDIENPYTFEEFCDGYYQFDLELQEYTDLLVDEAYGIICMADYEVSTLSDTSGDEFYIIKGDTANPSSSNFDPEVTPSTAFQEKTLNYTKFDYSTVKVGDILYETNTILLNIGHTAFVYDINKSATVNIVGRSTYIQTIEAVGEGVQFGYLDDKRMVDFGVVILRTTASSSKISQAKYFVWKQLGKEYDFPMDAEGRVNTSIDSAEWYCSELINAAYLYAGCNFNAVNSAGGVWPQDLLWCSKTSYVSFSGCLDLMLQGKENGKWKIRVYNSTGRTATVYYNTRLADVNIAKNWNNPKHEATVTITSGTSKVIYIDTYIFGSSAMFSTIKDGKRYITYGKDLNTTNRMCIFKNIINC